MKNVLKICFLTLLVGMAIFAFAACSTPHEHSFADRWSTNATHHWHAGNCAHTQQVADMGEHTWTAEGKITTPPTCISIGKNTFTCTTCGMTRNEDLDMVDHAYSDASWDYVAIDNVLYHEKRCDICDQLAERNEVANALVAADTAAAQEALDNATDGSILYLLPDVEYGILYLRADANDVAVNVENWSDGNNMYYRGFKNLTIIGGEGSMLDGIWVEADTFTPSYPHSNSDTLPYLQSYVALENLTIKNVTFSGLDNAFYVEGLASINGLTFDGCSMEDDDGYNYLLFQNVAVETYHDLISGEDFFTSGCKNITITNCDVMGAFSVVEMYGAENVTITDNTFVAIGGNVFLFGADTGSTYEGTITIARNKVEGCADRFLSADMVAADVVITENIVIDYLGMHMDIVSITNMTGESEITYNTWGADELTVTVAAPSNP